MNRNKILICLYIPLIEKSYDLFIPINKKIGTIFYSKETGQAYDVNKTVKDTDLKNGSRVILV